MPVLSASQIFDVTQQAGFTRDEGVIATAIAMAESGGNTAVVNGIGATGLWQIYDGHFPSSSRIAQLSDPLTNAKEALAKYHSQCWCPWAVFDEGGCNGQPCPGSGTAQRNNSWRNFLSLVQSVTGITGGGNVGGSGGGSGGSSGGSSGSGSSGGSSGGAGGFATDVLGGFFNQFAGPSVLALGLLFTVIGLLMWKGEAINNNVIKPTINTVSTGAKVAAVAA